jgi:diaminohydroxyphosphoribosylaminopyrimidine deaminase/5-amino-6-(5-phosphoribosylamino)uracil reductase
MGEAEKLNEAFIKHVTTGLPFVTMKIAQTLDGKIATASGESKWITGKEAREEGHRLRDTHDAILVGINTVLRDDPSLTARIPRGRDPLRVIVDSRLRTPLKAKVMMQRSSAGTLIATRADSPEARREKIRNAGAEIITVRSAAGRVDLKDLMRKLGKLGILSVLVEGGAEVHASALKAGIVDKAVVFIAPMLMTGKDSICSIGGTSPVKLGQALKLRDVTTHFAGSDLVVEGYVQKSEGRKART